MDAILTTEFDGFQTQFQALPVAVGARIWYYYYSIFRMQFPINVLYRSDM